MLPLDTRPGTRATLLNTPRFNRPGKDWQSTVVVVEIRKHTAHVEVRRRNGTTMRRFVKLSRLVPGALWKW